MARVLVIDDDAAIRETVALALERHGHAVERAKDVATARRWLDGARFDVVVSDIYMPGESGLDLLSDLRSRESAPSVILMTARGTVETAAIASRVGAFDYLAKPFDVDQLAGRVRAALRAVSPAETTGFEPGPRTMIVGSSPAIVEVYKAIARVARLSIPVLVTGETGTGKELVARAIHDLGSNPDGPYVAIHCGAIPDTLLESELFGHVRGAFTDAKRDHRGALDRAHGGTALLDEIGEISPAFQVKLLRFLQDGVITPVGAEKEMNVDVRIVAATNRDLRRLAAEGSFRQDLYFRLAAYEIRVPPLRDRIADLPLLVDHFRREMAKEGLDPGPVSRTVVAALEGHSWPGNVRELEQVLRRLAIDEGRLADPEAARRVIREVSLPVASPPGPGPGTKIATEEREETGPSSLEDAERRHIARVLEATGGNRTRAAEILGIERKTLRRKMQRLGIGVETEPDEEETKQ